MEACVELDDDGVFVEHHHYAGADGVHDSAVLVGSHAYNALLP